MLGFLVGTKVGFMEGFLVGTEVGCMVGFVDGTEVGKAVGVTVGCNLHVHSCFGHALTFFTVAHSSSHLCCVVSGCRQCWAPSVQGTHSTQKKH